MRLFGRIVLLKNNFFKSVDKAGEMGYNMYNKGRLKRSAERG